jgi:transposase
LNEAGEMILEQELPTTPKGFEQVFSKIPRSRVALETGTHSPWVSRQLSQLGHEVIVAHARNVRLISESSRKDDRLDARALARLARIDPGLLSPVRHRSAKTKIHLTVIRARAALVSTRTALVNAARGLTKSYGARLRKCGTAQMNREIIKELKPELREALDPLLAEIESLNERIAEYDRRIEQIAKDIYPEVARLKQVRSRAINCVDLRFDSGWSASISVQSGCGMLCWVAPWTQELGMSEPQLHISKEGDRYLRTLLVQGAHYIMGPFGQDSDLRRWA